MQAAVLTPVAGVLGHLALLVAPALVAQLLPDAPLKESLAAFAGDGPVVTAWGGRFVLGLHCMGRGRGRE